MRTLVTGASGFVGSSVVARLLADAVHDVVAASRSAVLESSSRIRAAVGYSLDPTTDWQPALQGVHAVIHLAARVHVMDDRVADPLAEFRRVNTAGSIRLAQQAAVAGVRRFVYVSSIKVNGEFTQPSHPFKADDVPAPQDAYAISKLEAEQALQGIAERGGMELVIVRPPLVYGPGVRANFLAMMHWLQRGVPLPLGAIHNRRTLIALDNLSDLLVTCATHPAAAGQIFLAGDAEDMSTTDLLLRLAAALGRSARLLPVPPLLLRSLLKVTGRRDLERRICGWLQVDGGKSRRMLGWNPPISTDEGLRRTAHWYLRNKGRYIG